MFDGPSLPLQLPLAVDIQESRLVARRESRVPANTPLEEASVRPGVTDHEVSDAEQGKDKRLNKSH